ncbi:UNVERIFIED_CONTAM: hypothetical protein RMT77_011213 [Armadillidium vulgare]
MKLIFCLQFGLILFSYFTFSSAGDLEEEKYGVIFANECEVCKLVTKEVTELLESHDSSDVIETGYNIDSKNKKKTKYNKSELRLVEVLEDTCNGMSDYRVHKERKDSTRWAKSMSQTFKTLHGLVNKGVKVELGIPMELWDEPSAEVGQLKTQCEQFLEDHEELINNWYFGDQHSSLQSHVCESILKDKKCLSEPYGEEISSSDSEKDQGSSDPDTREKSEL